MSAKDEHQKTGYIQGIALRCGEDLVLKRKIITLSTTIMLGMGGMLAVPEFHAKANIQASIDEAQEKLSSLRAKKADIEAQIAKLEQAIKDNNKKIEETNAAIKQSEADVETLNKEIAIIEERIAQRTEILKERAVSYQENGGQLGYLDVIFGASTFSEFIERLGAVATIFEADTAIIKKLDKDQTILKEKQAAVEKKLTELTNMKQELEGMKAQMTEQQAKNEELKQKLLQDEANSIAEIASLKQRQQEELRAAVNTINQAANTAANHQTTAVKEQAAAPAKTNTSNLPSTPASSGSVSAVINAGYKYIGNSVYVFGGGRTASDIAAGRFDCSGFVAWAFSQAGIKVGASTEILKNTGTRVPVSEMRPGDMVFFNTYKTDGHVGIYIGGGKFIGSQTSTGVAIANMSSGYWAKTFNGRVMRVIH